MDNLQFFPFTEIHVNTTWQARVKAAHGPHDIYALEFVWPIFFKDGCILHGIFVGTRSAIDIAHAPIPRSRRVRMIIGNLPILDDHVMGKDTTYRLVEATANGLLRYGEIVPRSGVTGM